MNTTTTVWVTSQFEAYHRWKDAPDDVEFLRHWHRHLFHVKLGVVVTGDNRQVEFFQLKRQLDSFLIATFSHQQFEYSCEQIASQLLEQFQAEFAEVSEDRENGAVVSQVASALLSIPNSTREPENATWTGNQGLLGEKKTKCFVGVEAEGPNRGSRVLFVPGTVSPYELKQSLEKVGFVDRVYYGAGNNREIRKDTLLALLRVPRIKIDVELESGLSLPNDLRNLLAETEVNIISLDPEDFPWVSYLKVFSKDKVFWIKGRGDMWTTDLNDPLFSQDKTVAISR